MDPFRRLLSALCVLLCVGLFVPALLPAHVAAAQELDCRVTVDYRQLSGSDYTFLKELEERIAEYMNARSWTQDRFLDQERIDCTMQVTFEEAFSLTSFRARLVVATRRPIYGTIQSTTVVQFNDADWQFGYTQGAPLIHEPERYDPLTSILDFYAYIILGYDYDTFSALGGTPHFERARRIAQLAQSQGRQGWTQVGAQDQGRYSLITQIMDRRYDPLRKAYFDYHFGGLDRFVLDTEAARANVLGVLESLQELYNDVSRSYAIDLFFSAKYQELAGLFEGARTSTEVYTLLSRVDPAHLSEYNRLTR